MISSLSGTVASVSAETLVLEVGGVGLAVQCGPAVLRDALLGQTMSVSTSLVVREDSLTLYGFADADARDVFETLQSVSGIGPRVAQAVLSALTPEQLRVAVHTGDETTLTRVPGIGKKGAQRMVLELTGKLSAPVAAPIDVRDIGASAGIFVDEWQPQVRQALVSLGWSSREADDAVAAASPAEFDEFAAMSSSQQVSKMLAVTLRGLGRR